MNLFEKLNRLDDSLVKSTRVVKKNKLTESTENSKLNMKDRIEEIVFTEFETGHLFADDYESFKSLIRDEGLRATPKAYSYYQELHELGPTGFYVEFKDKFEFDSMFIDEYTNEVDDDYDYEDDIEEMLTENNNVSSQLPPTIDYFLQDIAQMYGTITYKDIMEHEYTEEDLKKLKNYRNRFRSEIPYEGDEEADKMLKKIANSVAQIVKSENMFESRNDPYFAPYGYRDAAKVLNGKAPEYYYHLKEIEMDRGDGVRLARYAMRKGLPVMVDKNSDPDYPEFAIKGEYHWDDYFYPYPTSHEEDLVAWDGKMFVE